jgi:hypothetical protein
MKIVDEVVLMLAGMFKSAYLEACARVGRIAELIETGVQDMRRLYVAARTRCCA